MDLVGTIKDPNIGADGDKDQQFNCHVVEVHNHSMAHDMV